MSVEASAAKDPDPAAISVPGVAAVATPQIQLIGPDRGSANDIVSNCGSIGVPFVDFVGRCFLRACLWMELLESWKREKQVLPNAKIESSASWKYQWHMTGWLRSSVGAASCTAVAGCLVPVFSGTKLSPAVPLLFLLVILYVALRFGNIAGIIGTVCAALVFASILFEPRPSLAISSPLERNLLFSMVILGVCASELLGRRKTTAVYKR
ncbi:MAG: hypothetical protein JWN74_925 [Acidobacteriaceae bacterium]|nr:hypothetical protein [Acidobacteriaceae bacterium]